MGHTRAHWLLPLLAVTLAHCSDADTLGHDGGASGPGAETGAVGECEPTSGPAEAGGVSRSTEARFNVELSALRPRVPALGDNRWDLLLSDSRGDPVPSANLSFSLWMPEHAHGSLKAVVVSDLGAGRYRADPLSFHMPGLWEVSIAIELQGTEDEATFTPCVTP